MYELYCKLRDDKGFKDADVVKRTKITKSTFTDWKTGRSQPKIEKLQKIADLFDVPVEYFTSNSKNEKNGDGKVKLSNKEILDVSDDADEIISKLQKGDSALMRFEPDSLSESDREYLRQSLISMFSLVRLRNKEKGNGDQKDRK